MLELVLIQIPFFSFHSSLPSCDSNLCLFVTSLYVQKAPILVWVTHVCRSFLDMKEGEDHSCFQLTRAFFLLSRSLCLLAPATFFNILCVSPPLLELRILLFSEKRSYEWNFWHDMIMISFIVDMKSLGVGRQLIIL